MNATLVCPRLRIAKDVNILLSWKMKESLCFCLTKVKSNQVLLLGNH